MTTPVTSIHFQVTTSSDTN